MEIETTSTVFEDLTPNDQAVVIRTMQEWARRNDLSETLFDALKTLPFQYLEAPFELIKLRAASSQLDTPLWKKFSG